MQRTDLLRIIFVLVLSWFGTAALFVPFTSNTSPWFVVTRHWNDLLLLLAVPFFLSISILAWQTRQLFADRLTTAEIVFAYLFSATAMAATAVFLGLATYGLADGIRGTFPRHIDDQLIWVPALVSSWLLMFVNVLQLLRNRRAGLSREAMAEAFLLGAYLPNAVLCLVIFNWVSGLGIGAQLIAVVSVGYLVAIVLLSREKPSSTSGAFG